MPMAGGRAMYSKEPNGSESAHNSKSSIHTDSTTHATLSTMRLFWVVISQHMHKMGKKTQPLCWCGAGPLNSPGGVPTGEQQPEQQG